MMNRGQIRKVNPARLLALMGADAVSILKTDTDRETVELFANDYRAGYPVEPAKIVVDSNNNILEADGRHRTLAAAMARVDAVPVIIEVRR